MKICVAMDSFKECMTALEACNAVKDGFQEVFGDDLETVIVPMADGGEGTSQALVDSSDGEIIEVDVLNPLFNEIKSTFGILGDKKTAVIEMATASGLEIIMPEERNPLLTTTYGTGELIKEALDLGVETIILGIGGSATNDGGAGMAAALGVKFLDANGDEIKPCGGELNKIVTIDCSNIDTRIKNTKFIIACDVTNPLTGEKGASNVFGRQKGGTDEMIIQLDKNLKHYANIIKETLGIEINEVEGAGAAGGLGGGAIAFLNGELKKGIEIVIEFANLEEKVKDVDLVITGEGRVDFQTQYGKTPVGVASVGKKYNKTVFALAGSIGDGYESVYAKGIDSVFSIMNTVCTLEEALKSGNSNLKDCSKNLARVLKSNNR